MKAQHKIYLSLLLLVVIPIGNYFTFFNPGTLKEEAILAASLAVVIVVYFFFFRRIFTIYPKIVAMKEKAIQSELFEEESKKEKDDLTMVGFMLEKLTVSVRKANLFIADIKSGKLHDKDEEEIEEGDFLMNSLNDLRNQMVELEEEEKERNWVSHGMSQFVDILRGNDESIGHFYDSIITNIVKYLNANQGSLFLVLEQGGKKHLSMEACYAYDRKKFINKEILAGEGLVGQVFLEKKTTYLKEIPENYITITSGLGQAPPRNLLLVPFILNDEVECIIEIASFHEIKKYQIDFLEKLGESVASAISSFRINESTKKLLEETQTQTEALRAQEEEMRQNMEELQATQESLERESLEKEKVQNEIQKTMDFMQSIINALPDPVFVKDRKHHIILVNGAYCKLNGVKAEDVVGKNDYDLFSKEEADKSFAAEEKLFLDRNEFLEEEQANINGETTYRITKKRIIEDDDGNLFLVGMNSDITESKRMAEDLKKEKYLMDALMHNTTDSIYFKDIESKFIRVSENMLKMFNAASQEQVIGKSDFDFFTKEHAQPAFDGEQEIIKTGKPILNLVEKETYDDGRFSYVSTTKVPLNDLDGKTIGTFGISRDVTEAKVIEIEMERREKLMNSLFNYSDEVLLIIDKEKALNFVSSNSYKMLGLNHNDMINHKLEEFIHRDDLKMLEKAIRSVKGEGELIVQFRHNTGDGGYVTVESNLYDALRDADIAGYVLKMKVVDAEVLA